MMQVKQTVFNYQRRNVRKSESHADNASMVCAINKELRLPPRLFGAFIRVDRRHFVNQREDPPYVPFFAASLLGEKITASAPFAVAHMLRLLGDVQGKKVLEIGSGSGYQTALLADLAWPDGKVVASERIATLIGMAKNSIRRADSVPMGWLSSISFFDKTSSALRQGPFDAIVVCCALQPRIFEGLANHLAEGGRLVGPVIGSDGGHYLTKLTKHSGEEATKEVLAGMPRKFVLFEPESEPAFQEVLA